MEQKVVWSLSQSDPKVEFPNKKWIMIIEQLVPCSSFKHSSISMIIFGLSTLILSVITIIDPSFILDQLFYDYNTDDNLITMTTLSSIAGCAIGLYYCYMSYHHNSHFYWITIWFRLFVTVPIMLYLSFGLSSSTKVYLTAIREGVGAIWTYIALKYDEYQYKQILNKEETFMKFLENPQYQITIDINKGSIDEFWNYFIDTSNMPEFHPNITVVKRCDDLSSYFTVDQHKYLRLQLVDEFILFNYFKTTLNYNALFEIDEENKRVIGYAYTWPDVYVVNIYDFNPEKVMHKTYISAPSLLKSMTVKQAYKSHFEALNNMKTCVENK